MNRLGIFKSTIGLKDLKQLKFRILQTLSMFLIFTVFSLSPNSATLLGGVTGHTLTKPFQVV